MTALSPTGLAEVMLGREIGRRGLLRTSLAGGLLLGIGAILPPGCRRYPPPPRSLEFLTSGEYAVVQAIARAILGLEGETVDVAAEVDRLVAGMERSVRRDLRWVLRIFERGTHLFDLKGKRFTALSVSEQEAYLRGWMTSSMGARRIVFRALKLLASLGYYGSARTWQEIGYEGPWIGRRPETGRFPFEPARPLVDPAGRTSGA